MNSKQLFSHRLSQALTHYGVPEKGRGRANQIASMFGVTANAVRKWLEAESLPETWRIIDIANVLGVRTEWLLSGQGRMLPDGSEPLDEVVQPMLSLLASSSEEARKLFFLVAEKERRGEINGRHITAVVNLIEKFTEEP
ncbi:hypothetical protein [Endozoicomonas sp. ALE010]|uniref:hypothetical protein n=1 Tax=Endozoicomonas sp. ALE010 TaxID=3403081 RepID=UPI003BB63ADD